MNKYIEYRREFHHYPEIGWTEIRTSARVAEILDKIGYRCKMGLEVLDEATISFETLDEERRKKEKTLENKFDELNEGILNEKDRENPHKVEHYVIERLEQMIETTKEIEDEKAEYKVVTSYLNDIQTLEGLTEEEKKPITDIASNIVALNQTNKLWNQSTSYNSVQKPCVARRR